MAQLATVRSSAVATAQRARSTSSDQSVRAPTPEEIAAFEARKEDDDAHE